MRTNYFGSPTRIDEEYAFYDAHFGPNRKNEQHAFYAGCLTMPFLSQERTIDQLKALADELEEWLKDDDCMCDECRRRSAEGTMPTLVERIFGRTAQ